MGSPRPGARKHACACTHTDTLVQTDAVTRAHTGATLPPCFRAAVGRLSPLQMPTRMCPGPARPLPGAAVGPRWATCVPGSPAASWDRALRRGSASPLVELGAVSLACLYFHEWLPAPANTGRVSCAAPPRPPADPLRPALKEPPPPGPPGSPAFLSAGPLQWLSSPAPGSPLSLSHRALRPWGSVLVAPGEGGLVQTRRGHEADGPRQATAAGACGELSGSGMWWCLPDSPSGTGKG